MSERSLIARAIFDETRRQYMNRDPVVRIDRAPVDYLTWEESDRDQQEPFLLMADAVLAVLIPRRLEVVR